MYSYLVRRLIFAALTVVVITFVVYALIRLMPGDAVSLELGESDPKRMQSAQERERQRKLYGLDHPWPVGYLIWAKNVTTHLDLGKSIFEKKPVYRQIGERFIPTLMLSGTSLFLAYVLSVPIGLYCSARSNKLDERGISLGMYMMYSFPSYVAALFLLTLFYLKLKGTHWALPLGGMVDNDHDKMSAWGQFQDSFRHLILPLTCMTYGSLAYDSRFIKANMEEVMRQDYIRTARAKGASYLRILVMHAFRNTLIPFLTILGISLPAILGGAVILEGIFGWPGMGQLFYQSVSRRDYDPIMALTLMFTVLTLAGQLLADILYAFADPRVAYK